MTEPLSRVPTMRLFRSLVNLAAVAALGCGAAVDSTEVSEKGSISSLSAADADEGLETDAAVHPVDTGEGKPAREGSLPKGENFDVEGVFRPSNQDTRTTGRFVTLKLVVRQPGGALVVVDSRSARAETATGGRFHFRGTLKAPEQGGIYSLQAWRDKRKFAESEVRVD